ESILNQTDTNLFMCQVSNPLVAHKRLTLFCPPLAETELGFMFCMEKIIRLSQELSIPIHCIGVERTNTAIDDYLTQHKRSVRIVFSVHTEWDELRDLRKFVNESDLIVFISARRGELSYRYSFDRIPKKLEKVYHQYNRILVFPKRRGGRS